MTRYRKRGPDGTLQAQVFAFLRAVGSFDATMLGDHFGVRRQTMASTCRELMLKKKIAKKRMRGRWVIWYALPFKKAPEDQRGKPDACRNGGYANVLAMLNARCGMNWRPRSCGATALEQAWPIPRRQSNELAASDRSAEHGAGAHAGD